ncbi:hypothetical protein [Adhaeribacter rhizoryzae]|uniref:Uncharacterized protein n=1 Tax=Adhaeribacter rhizoryzae TaxID=2607907 RepID=A0A5M6D4N7_9BACT|nr:hypothetical protein [Adhaeribacter rhizoryzae]KAA5542478.1 hypothetical protein F0145_18685 [Adhaeribacter rhizoryzae]
MKDNKNKDQDAGKDILKDINSVPKMAGNKDNVGDPKRPAKGGSRGTSSDQDGGQDAGSSAGSH